jgi:8-oxo-dGTP pyrophosphatase MutT (NUDIX family)
MPRIPADGRPDLRTPLAPGALGAGTAESPRRIVDVWPVVPGPAGPRLLLLHRAPDHFPFWQGVSGSIEAGDAHLEAAALREICEETGLGPEGIEIHDLGLEYTFTSPLSGRIYHKRSLAAILPPATTLEQVTLSEEHDDVRLVTWEEARRLVRFPQNLEELDALARVVGGLR